MIYIQVFLWVKFVYRNFNSYKVKVTDKTDSMYSSNSSFSQSENVQATAQPSEMGHIKKMYIVDYDTAESVRKFAWFKIVLDLNKKSLLYSSSFSSSKKVLGSQDTTAIKEVGLCVFGNCLETQKKISIISLKIGQTVYILDFIEIMKEAADASKFIRLIGDYLTDESIVKIFSNCKFIADLFWAKFRIKIVNIFDLDVS